MGYNIAYILPQNMENNMATVQINGSSAVTATSTRNNHGSAINVGSSALLSNQALGRAESSVFGSTVISNATNDYADPALSEGTFVAMSASVTKTTEPWGLYKGIPAIKYDKSTKDL